jgi:probable HAF family extracellular repeat protein
MSVRNCVCTTLLATCVSLAAGCSATNISALAGDANASDPHRPALPDSVRGTVGFLWSAEAGLQTIPLPENATSMTVTAMNNKGQVVGYFIVGQEEYRAFFWSTSAGFKQVGSLTGAGGISMALAINDLGEVTGVSEGPSTIWNGPMGVVLQDSFVWTEHSGIRALKAAGPPPSRSVPPAFAMPAGTDCSAAVGANARGQIIGYAGKLNDGPSRGLRTNGDCSYQRALLWGADGSFDEIASCGPRSECAFELTAVNNSGEVVGNSASEGSFRWTSSRGFVWLPLQNAGISVVNDSGDAAGTFTTGGATVPFVWMASGTIKKIEMPAGATFGGVVAINDKLQVAGDYR